MMKKLQAMLAKAKGQKGAMFVEYALIIAFVVIVGVVFMSDDGAKGNIKSAMSINGSNVNSIVTSAGNTTSSSSTTSN